MNRFDVLVIGGTGVDTIVRVDDLAIPSGDVLLVPPIKDYVAHTGNGVALGLHSLGLRTKFIDYVGDDMQGRTITSKYKNVGLDFSGLPAPEGTPRSVNLVDRQGRRFSFYDGRHPHDLRMPKEFAHPFIEESGHVHISRSEHARDLFPVALAAGKTVSTDVQGWDGISDHTNDYAYSADIVFMSGEFVHGREADVSSRIMTKGRAAVVVIMDGANGCYVRLREDAVLHHYPATPPSRPVVDSNGAGDAFVSAFLFGWLRGDPLDEAVLGGLVSGAFACGSHGTHEEQIDVEQLRQEKKRIQATP